MALTQSLMAQASMKDFSYLKSLPAYEVIEGDSADQEFGAYKFFDGKSGKARKAASGSVLTY
jgi:hypothetical protein